MRQIVISLAALVAAASLVAIAHATMTTILPLRMLQDGATDSVALFGASCLLGFAVGCFSEPPRILRVEPATGGLAAAPVRCTMTGALAGERPGAADAPGPRPEPAP